MFPFYILLLTPLETLELALLVALLPAAIWLGFKLRALDRELEGLSGIEALKKSLRGLQALPGEQDLRRIERQLAELADDQRRIGQQMLQLAEARREAAPEQEQAPGALPKLSLSERAINRLLALGYEEIRILETIDAEESEVERSFLLVEARSRGAIFKGRVTFEGGAILDVDLKSSHEMFP